jgi:hypothetical protein
LTGGQGRGRTADLPLFRLAAITRQAIRRGSFTSVRDLVAAIENFIDGWNDRCQPFTWTKTADGLLPHCSPARERRSRDTRGVAVQ